MRVRWQRAINVVYRVQRRDGRDGYGAGAVPVLLRKRSLNFDSFHRLVLPHLTLLLNGSSKGCSQLLRQAATHSFCLVVPPFAPPKHPYLLLAPRTCSTSVSRSLASCRSVNPHLEIPATRLSPACNAQRSYTHVRGIMLRVYSSSIRGQVCRETVPVL